MAPPGSNRLRLKNFEVLTHSVEVTSVCRPTVKGVQRYPSGKGTGKTEKLFSGTVPPQPVGSNPTDIIKLDASALYLHGLVPHIRQKVSTPWHAMRGPARKLKVHS